MFNFINNLSPIEAVRSISTAHTFNSLCFTSPPPVFTSPHPTFHRESRFFSWYNRLSFFNQSSCSSCFSIGWFCIVVSVSKEEVEDLNKDASLEEEEEEMSSELPHILNDSPCMPNLSEPPPGESVSYSEDFKVSLLKLLDAQEENDTPARRRLISDAAELLVFRSPCDSEAFQCLVDTVSSSERRSSQTKQHDVTKDVQANGYCNDNEPLAVGTNQVNTGIHVKV